MTDMPLSQPVALPDRKSASLLQQDARTKARNAAEKRFRLYGVAAIAISMIALVVLLATILTGGAGAFRQTYLNIPVTLDAAVLDPKGNRDPAEMAKVLTLSYGKVLDAAVEATVARHGIQIEGLSDKDIDGLISKEASAQVRNRVLAEPDLIGQTVEFDVLTGGRIDGFFKGRVTMESAARDSNTSPQQLQLAQELADRGEIVTRFNWNFLRLADASDQRP